MRRGRSLAAGVGLFLGLTACTPGGTTPLKDPGKVVPVRHFAVPGRLYAVKGRRLYQFSGSAVNPVAGASSVKDPAVTLDGARLAYAQIQGQSSTIVVGQSDGQGTERITSGSAAEGALWAFAPAFSTDGRHLAYLTDRGKQSSNPQSLQPNDLGVWQYDIISHQSVRLVSPTAYTGGDSDPVFRPGATDQLVYTSYLYEGYPLQPVARLTWMSTQTGRTSFLSPSLARNLEPSFSPDGKFLAFIHGGVEGDDLYVTPVGSSYAAEPRPYPAETGTLLEAGMVAQPVWAPDGSSLAFLMLVKGSFDLYVLPISTAGGVRATGPAVAITQGSFFDADSRLAWSP
jgi:Tol biopolymer transport system component